MKRGAQAPARRLVTALDVGSSKVSALIAEPGENGELRILGTGQRQSRGVQRGYVSDMEKTEAAIREAVERRSGSPQRMSSRCMSDFLRADW